MLKKGLYFICISILFTSCNFLTHRKKESNIIVAKVYDKFLTQQEINDIIPSDIIGQDSIVFVKNYIDTWAKKQLLLHQSELNLDQEKESFEKLVEDYRSTLYINAYKEGLVNHKLDTTISDSEIEKYYSANYQNFKLNEELLQIKYLHTNSDRNDKKGLIKLFKSTKKEDQDSLKLRGLEFLSYNFNDSIWIKYSELIEKIDFLKTENKKQLLKKSNFIKKEDTISLYLITVKDVLNNNDIAPLSYVRPTIKQIILHKRKLELLRKIEVDLLNDAIKSQNFEKY